MNKKSFQKDVLMYYDTSQRVLPWRESRNPYYIWVSEIMLQQTRVETVIPYYNRFIYEMPTIKDLAVASEDKLYKLWEGLGYYSRVLNMKTAARTVLSEFNGELPQNREELESLKGIGPYTSGAISSIAFNQKNSAVDGNVYRIFYRLLELHMTTKNKEGKQIVKNKVESLLPNERIGDFNQGLMEIGATICLPNGKPLCEICPLKQYCKSYKNSTQNEIPLKRRKVPTPIYNKTVLVIQYQDSVAIEKRPDKGLLKSMYQFILKDNHLSEKRIISLFEDVILDIKKLEPHRHKFSHLQWNLEGYKIVVSRSISDYHFVPIDTLLNEYSIPSAFKTYKKVIMEEQK